MGKAENCDVRRRCSALNSKKFCVQSEMTTINTFCQMRSSEQYKNVSRALVYKWPHKFSYNCRTENASHWRLLYKECRIYEEQDSAVELISAMQFNRTGLWMFTRSGLDVTINVLHINGNTLRSSAWQYYYEYDTRRDNYDVSFHRFHVHVLLNVLPNFNFMLFCIVNLYVFTQNNVFNVEKKRKKFVFFLKK